MQDAVRIWDIFFKTLREGEPFNTFKPPKKEYYQYKFHLRDRDNRWLLSIRGGNRPILDVSNWHYNVTEALEFFSSIGGSI